MCQGITNLKTLPSKEVKLETIYFEKHVLLLYLPLMIIFLLSTELISPQKHIKDPFPYCNHLRDPYSWTPTACFFHLLLEEIKRKELNTVSWESSTTVTWVSLRIINYFASVSQSLLTTTKSKRTTQGKIQSFPRFSQIPSTHRTFTFTTRKNKELRCVTHSFHTSRTLLLKWRSSGSKTSQ